MKKFMFVFALLLAGAPFGEGSALTASQAQLANAAAVTKVTYHPYRHRRHYGHAVYSNWCSYNCIAVSPCHHGCLGAYGYSHFLYDEDLPFHYRYDRDASPTDNGLAILYPYTGEPFLRIFERRY